jgi:hypothetical protein
MPTKRGAPDGGLRTPRRLSPDHLRAPEEPASVDRSEPEQSDPDQRRSRITSPFWARPGARSGKSNGAKVIAEEALDAGERVCILDPTGAWWGLRLKANGKPSSYPVVIFGGLHGDVVIGRGQGAAVAE